jgi:hypothetical protein
MRICLFSLALMLPLEASPLTPQPLVTTKGMAALLFAETGSRAWMINFGGGSPGGGLYCFCDYGGSHYNLPKVATLNGQTITQTYSWGTCNVTFRVLSDKTLDISGSVTNSSSAALTNLQLILDCFPG